MRWTLDDHQLNISRLSAIGHMLIDHLAKDKAQSLPGWITHSASVSYLNVYLA